MNFKYFRTQLRLLLQTPIDYLYSFTYSNEKKIRLYPYSDQAAKIADYFISQIKVVCPDLPVSYIGSSALKIIGNKDIDLCIACPPQQFPDYLPGLINIFGQPAHTRSKIIDWKLNKNGYEVDISLIDPKSFTYKDKIKNFNKLKNNPELKEAYINLKNQANGLSEREYDRRKIEFFNKMNLAR